MDPNAGAEQDPIIELGNRGNTRETKPVTEAKEKESSPRSRNQSPYSDLQHKSAEPKSKDICDHDKDEACGSAIENPDQVHEGELIEPAHVPKDAAQISSNTEQTLYSNTMKEPIAASLKKDAEITSDSGNQQRTYAMHASDESVSEASVDEKANDSKQDDNPFKITGGRGLKDLNVASVDGCLPKLPSQVDLNPQVETRGANDHVLIDKDFGSPKEAMCASTPNPGEKNVGTNNFGQTSQQISSCIDASEDVKSIQIPDLVDNMISADDRTSLDKQAGSVEHRGLDTVHESEANIQEPEPIFEETNAVNAQASFSSQFEREEDNEKKLLSLLASELKKPLSGDKHFTHNQIPRQGAEIAVLSAEQRKDQIEALIIRMFDDSYGQSLSFIEMAQYLDSLQPGLSDEVMTEVKEILHRHDFPIRPQIEEGSGQLAFVRPPQLYKEYVNYQQTKAWWGGQGLEIFVLPALKFADHPLGTLDKYIRLKIWQQLIKLRSSYGWMPNEVSEIIENSGGKPSISLEDWSTGNRYLVTKVSKHIDWELRSPPMHEFLAVKLLDREVWCEVMQMFMELNNFRFKDPKTLRSFMLGLGFFNLRFLTWLTINYDPPVWGSPEYALAFRMLHSTHLQYLHLEIDELEVMGRGDGYSSVGQMGGMQELRKLRGIKETSFDEDLSHQKTARFLSATTNGRDAKADKKRPELNTVQRVDWHDIPNIRKDAADDERYARRRRLRELKKEVKQLKKEVKHREKEMGLRGQRMQRDRDQTERERRRVERDNQIKQEKESRLRIKKQEQEKRRQAEEENRAAREAAAQKRKRIAKAKERRREQEKVKRDKEKKRKAAEKAIEVAEKAAEKATEKARRDTAKKRGQANTLNRGREKRKPAESLETMSDSDNDSEDMPRQMKKRKAIGKPVRRKTKISGSRTKAKVATSADRSESEEDDSGNVSDSEETMEALRLSTFRSRPTQPVREMRKRRAREDSGDSQDEEDRISIETPRIEALKVAKASAERKKIDRAHGMKGKLETPALANSNPKASAIRREVGSNLRKRSTGTLRGRYKPNTRVQQASRLATDEGEGDTASGSDDVSSSARAASDNEDSEVSEAV